MSYADRQRDADHEWRMAREESMTVPCPQCHAPRGVRCRNTLTDGDPRFPAHPQRITAASAPPTAPTSDETEGEG